MAHNRLIRSVAAALAAVAAFAQPAYAGISVLGDLCHDFRLKSGQTENRVIRVRNTGNKAEEVNVYQTEYTATGGVHMFDALGKNKRSNASWIGFSPRRLTVPAGSTADIKYTLKVPDDSSLRGTYWSVLMIEPEQGRAVKAENADKKAISITINQKIRTAVKVITNVNREGLGTVRFVSTGIKNIDTKRYFEVVLENTSEKLLRPLLWLELYSKGGLLQGRYECARKSLYPGSTEKFPLDLTKAQPGEYKALAVADAGGNDVFGATYDLQLQGETPASEPPAAEPRPETRSQERRAPKEPQRAAPLPSSGGRVWPGTEFFPSFFSLLGFLLLTGAAVKGSYRYFLGLLRRVPVPVEVKAARAPVRIAPVAAYAAREEDLPTLSSDIHLLALNCRAAAARMKHPGSPAYGSRRELTRLLSSVMASLDSIIALIEAHTQSGGLPVPVSGASARPLRLIAEDYEMISRIIASVSDSGELAEGSRSLDNAVASLRTLTGDERT